MRKEVPQQLLNSKYFSMDEEVRRQKRQRDVGSRRPTKKTNLALCGNKNE